MPHYAAPSPDEIAIIKGAFINGVKLLSRDSNGVTVQICIALISFLNQLSLKKIF